MKINRYSYCQPSCNITVVLTKHAKPKIVYFLLSLLNKQYAQNFTDYFFQHLSKSLPIILFYSHIVTFYSYFILFYFIICVLTSRETWT